MKILNYHEIRMAVGLLQRHIPKSLTVYGFVFNKNRVPESVPDLEVIVDKWPDFSALVCRRQTKSALEHTSCVSFFCTDKKILSNMLTDEDVIDWRAHVIFEGFDISFSPLLKEMSWKKKTRFSWKIRLHLLHLPDCDSLLSSEHSEVDFKMSSLNDSHVELVNTTWKYGGDENAFRTIKKMINNFPSYCIIDDHGQPVSWILVYDHGAMGILYTLPAHRGKGHAKALLICMARKLHSQGFPVYSFIEEENTVSYRLYKNLGFIEDPSYWTAWTT